jgi:Protein of unknown function (DUF5818)
MKSLLPLRLLGLAALALGMTVSLNAQQAGSQQDPQQPGSQDPSGQQTMSEPQPDQQQSQTFVGKIMKSKGGIMLKDSATNSTYKLDNAAAAKPYAGKTVKVTGTLDPATNTIHVANIEEPPAS